MNQQLGLLYYQMMSKYDQIEHAMVSFAKKYPEYSYGVLGIQKFSDGWIFYTILRSVKNFKINPTDLQSNPTTWAHRLSNLKTILSYIESYFNQRLHKSIKTKDIDLMEIAKNSNVEEITKYFEIIIAVLTESSDKQDHINLIMGLDELSQSVFVRIIQSILEHRIFCITDKYNQVILQEASRENKSLKEEVEELLQCNSALQKQVTELKNRMLQPEPDYDQYNEQSHQNQRLRNQVQTLKQKISFITREHQQKLLSYREQMDILQDKLHRHNEIQYELQEYKIKYSQNLESVKNAKNSERQKIKLNRIIEDKQVQIKKLQYKIDEINEKNFALEQKQLNLRMQLEKQDVRFKQLEKQAERRYESSMAEINDNATSLTFLNGNHNMSSANTTSLNYELDMQEFEESRLEVEKYKKKIREAERQNIKLRRQIDRVVLIENQKKKLEKLIMDVNEDKVDHIELLLETVYSLFLENQQLQKTIDELQHRGVSQVQN